MTIMIVTESHFVLLEQWNRDKQQQQSIWWKHMAAIYADIEDGFPFTVARWPPLGPAPIL